MRDDYIQGILFSRSDLVDLRRMNASDRRMFKMLAAKKTMRDWSTVKLPLAGQTSQLKPGHVIRPLVQ